MKKLSLTPDFSDGLEGLNIEKIRENTVFGAIFVDPKNLYSKFAPSLEQQIKNPHVTISYLPDTSKLYLDQLGSTAKITVMGYGKDDKNEGLLVKVDAGSPSIQQTVDNGPVTPHITLSISSDGKAKDTKDLLFTPLEEPSKIDGKYGLFMQDSKIVYDKEGLKKYNQ